ncbi:MAG: glycosyltransferase family 39 protein [Isosphaeraceae bacterium]
MTPIPRWCWPVLALVLVLDVLLRAHTFSAGIRDRWGIDLDPYAGKAIEPIDCDEAVYTYAGRRILAGDVMYRDLTEPKPPGGYWLYALGVRLGGDDEWMVRLLPLPIVMVTIVLVGWIAGKLAGPSALIAASLAYAVASTDPFLYGNGSNLEHPMNLATVTALAALLVAWSKPDGGRVALLISGVSIGTACLFKQVCGLHAIVFGLALLIRPGRGRARSGDLAVLAAGVIVPISLAALALIIQGAGPAAYEDIFAYAKAMARDLPAEPSQPPLLVRWFTGNAAPDGVLPPPFGSTNYLVWWAWGTWPLWLGAIPPLMLMTIRGPSPRRLVVAWTLSAWVQVLLPRLFWAHYYLLPLPGLAIAVGIGLADGLRGLGSGKARRRSALLAAAMGLSTLATAALLTRNYLRVEPVELTIRYKGGRQWVALRQLGRDLGRRSKGWEDPRIFVWGWQSPLFIYSGMDGVSRHFFADNLIKTYAGRDHPLIKPRTETILADLQKRPPEFVFAGYPPFPALRTFLDAHYVQPQPNREGLGLWVEGSKAAEFAAGVRP